MKEQEKRLKNDIITNESHFYSLLVKSKNLAFNRHVEHGEIHDWQNNEIKNVDV